MDAMPDHPIPDARGTNLHRAALDRAAALAERVAGQGEEPLARQTAAGLYHAITLAWEAEHCGLPHRRALANLVLLHHLTPCDPLAAPDDTALINEALAAA